MPAGQRLGWAEPRAGAGRAKTIPLCRGSGSSALPAGRDRENSSLRSVVSRARGACLLSFSPVAAPSSRWRSAMGTSGAAAVAAWVPPSLRRGARQGRANAAAAKAGTAFSEGGLVLALSGEGGGGEGALARPQPHDPARPPPVRAQHLLRHSTATAACERGLTWEERQRDRGGDRSPPAALPREEPGPDPARGVGQPGRSVGKALSCCGSAKQCPRGALG